MLHEWLSVIQKSLGNQVDDWIMNLRDHDVGVFIDTVIANARSSNPDFRNRSATMHSYWVYQFNLRYNLGIQTAN